MSVSPALVLAAGVRSYWHMPLSGSCLSILKQSSGSIPSPVNFLCRFQIQQNWIQIPPRSAIRRVKRLLEVSMEGDKTPACGEPGLEAQPKLLEHISPAEGWCLLL